MSVKYRNSIGQETIIAGLTPGGDLEAGAVAQRTKTVSIPTLAADAGTEVTVAFDSAMPDSDYIVNIETTSARLNFEIRNKTANGFTLYAFNVSGATSSNDIPVTVIATKTYTVQHAAQNAESIANIESKIPSAASSTNQLTTKTYVDNADNALDNRLDNIEDIVPNTASITNKLVTQSDLSAISIDELGDIGDVNLTSPADGETLIWDNTNSEWVNGQGGKTYTEGHGIDIDSNDEISIDETYVPSTFVGTTQEWTNLSATEKAKYNLVTLTDDADYVGNITDSVVSGGTDALSSGGAYTALSTKLDKTGDSKDNTTTFTSSDVADGSATSWTSVTKLATGEKHSSIFAKMSQMFKNVRYLYKLLGTTDISSIGNGTITGAVSTLNNDLSNKGGLTQLLSGHLPLSPVQEYDINISGYKGIYIEETNNDHTYCVYIPTDVITSSYKKYWLTGFYWNTGSNCMISIAIKNNKIKGNAFLYNNVSQTTIINITVYGVK